MPLPHVLIMPSTSCSTQINTMSIYYLELIAVIFGILSVWYARSEKILVFPFGIVNVLIFVYIFFVSKLYANAAINLVYFLTNAFGWYNWARQRSGDSKLKISKNSGAANLLLLFGVVLLYVCIYFLLKWVSRADVEYSQSAIATIDAANTAVFFVATLLMAFKKLENWFFWIVGNLISIPIFFSQELYFTSFQYAVFLALAISGYLEWKKKLT